jgi:histidinol phosphatase-like PHP family hydrolase
VRDPNAAVFVALRELAAIQTLRPKAQALGSAAATIWALERPLPDLRAPDGSWPKLPGVGPSSMRIVDEVLATGRSDTVERAVAASARAAILEAARPHLHLLSRAQVVQTLKTPTAGLVGPADYRGDLQMHSTWSDGRVSIAELAGACAARGYEYCSVTDHAEGLRIARGLTPEAVVRQHDEIHQLNAAASGFRILKGIEANIAPDGTIDVTSDDLRRFDIVLAAPHAHLRTADDQTARLVRVVRTPGVHVLAHPRGRVAGTRPGIVADWDAVFSEAAHSGVAIEIDGFAERQDLDHPMAARAAAAGCLLALDSDAHGSEQLVFAETAIAQARLARVPVDRIVNTWPLERLLDWSAERRGS